MAVPFRAESEIEVDYRALQYPMQITGRFVNVFATGYRNGCVAGDSSQNEPFRTTV
jgi:hypothetical protein